MQDKILFSNTRNGEIVKTSLVGIVSNIFLSVMKASVGFAVGSLSVKVDSVNNLTDALSSFMVVLGAKLSGKPPDKRHPLGHGRSEYIATFIIGIIIFYVGITSLITSFKKIINPVNPSYTALSLALLSVSFFMKLFLGVYFRRRGRKFASGSLEASGVDAFFDAVISFAVILSAVIYMKTGFSLEAYLGLFISALIIRSGFDILKNTMNDLLGQRIEKKLSKEIKEELSKDENVLGAYDLYVSDYGPEKRIASVNVEVSNRMTADEIDHMTRRLQEDILEKFSIVLVSVGVYASETKDPEGLEMKNRAEHILLEIPGIIQIHGFHFDKDDKKVYMDAVLSFDVKDETALVKSMIDKLKEEFPGYSFFIKTDIDVSD